MQPLLPATPVPLTDDAIKMQAELLGVDEHVIRGIELDENLNTKYWTNNKYTVTTRVYPKSFGDNTDVMHISIRRNDRKAVRDWRHVQAIKNQLAGPEYEGVELYPAESRVVDLANQFHLWVLLDENIRFPFGFHEGRRTQDESGGGAVQRPREM